MTRDIAVIPVKGLVESKSRLNRAIAPQEKRKLILAMLKDVLGSVKESGLFERIIVVSLDRNVEREANLDRGVFLQQEGQGLNSGIRQATVQAIHARATSVAVFLADIPLIQPKDLKELYAVGSTAERVVLSPSLKGGTNVMIREPPELIQPAYGRWSFSNHLRAAQKIGTPVYSVSNQRLSFDIDTPEDLALVARKDPHAKTHTVRALREASTVHVAPRASK